jgi:PAS domain S-box-containing protein
MEISRLDVEASALAFDGSLFTGGRVGALMRTVDWSATPLGPTASWPQSLRTALSICIASRFPILVWWGPELVKLYNDAYAEILGAKHPSALGARGREVWPEIWDIIGPMLDGVMTRGEATWSADLLLPLQRKGFSEECYFTFSYSPIRDETGGIGGVFTAVTETTERVLSERRLATLSEISARTSGARRTTAEACRAAAATLDANRADVPFAAIYLADRDDEARLVATSSLTAGSPAAPNVIALRSTDGIAAAPWPVAEAMARGVTVDVGQLPARLGSLGGPWSESAHRALAIPIRRGDNDRPYGVLIAGTSPRLQLDEGYRGFFDLVAGQIATAVSGARAYEEERQRAEALAELDRAKTIFFSNVSHEFRTPLTLMLGPLEDALGDVREPLPGGQRNRLALVQRNGLRLLKLVNSLLDFSRIEAGRVQARYEPVDLAAMTADLASSFHSATDRAGLRLVVECAPLGEPVYVDEAMWEKIVLNLLSNAFKFTLGGEIRVTVGLVGGHAELRVADTGCGIPADALPRIFERFHRVEGARSRTHEGSGIGLSLVQELVKLHGGTIAVASEEGRGTTFTVRVPLGTSHLPRERLADRQTQSSTRLGAAPFVEEALRWLPGADEIDDLPPRSVMEELDTSRQDTIRGHRARVLVVDDNADMRAYLARLLAPSYEIVTAADGVEALERMSLTKPDLVVSDVMMPRLDGTGLLRALRSADPTRTMPVILLSARAGEEATVEGLNAGADDYLVKPFSARELLTRVRTHLELAAERARAANEREMLIRELEGERTRLLELFDQAPAFLAALHGPTHVFTLTNPAYEELIGFRDVMGKPVREALPELADQGFFDILDHVYAAGEPYTATAARVVLNRGDTVDECFLDFVYQPMRDPNGRVDGIMVHGVDVTTRVHARRKIEELLQGVREASEAKTKFLSMMSHELRTPLNAITGFADLLSLGVRGPITPEQADDVRRIRNASQYLLSIINDLLNFTRLDAGHVEFRTQDVSVAAAIADAQPLIAMHLRDKSLSFVFEGCPEGLTVRADRERLQQILLNLLTNAIKFTAPGGRIGVDCQAGDGFASIAISDTGRGIPADQLERIFDPFVQVDRHLGRDSQGGVGLGLAISRDLSRAMGGDLMVDSTLGSGSTFTVRLPLA